MKQIFLCSLLIFLTGYLSAQTLASVVPSNATTTDNNVLVVMTLTGQVPPTTVLPLSATIGMVSGIGISRNGNDVSAYFDFTSTNPGIYDAFVTFPGPQGNVDFILANSFTVAGSGGNVTFFVNGANGSDANDGSSWLLAKETVQAGISGGALAGFADVWVASGTYLTNTVNDRNASFEMVAGVNIYGGFIGTETDLAQRDFLVNQTILSGDIGVQSDSSDNAFHVVIGISLAIIDGFTVRDGNANGEFASRLGGGIYMEAASPTITNCRFTNNYAEDGGALYIFNDSKPNISNCIFSDNVALLGGAVVCRVGGAATIDGCSFIGNFAEWRGGGLFVDYGAYNTSPVTITNCDFTNNSTNGNGGGFYCDDLASQYMGTYITVSGTSFTGNHALYRGGGMSNFNENIFITITNCDFTGNSADAGGNAIANDYKVTATISSCSFDSGSSQDVDSDSSCSVTIN